MRATLLPAGPAAFLTVLICMPVRAADMELASIDGKGELRY